MDGMTSERPRTPNVLLMHCHDVGRFLGCYGVPTVRTPNLDALAADGVRLAQAYATAPQCSPSRSSLYTGRWPHNNGVMGLTHSHFAWDLHAEERHLATELKDAGYETVLIGVHHESRVRPDEELAQRLGFDEVVTGGLADVVADRTVERLERLAGNEKPFYLQVGFIEPHRMGGKRDPDGVMGFLGNHLEPDTELGVTVPPYLVDDAGARTEVAELQGAVRFMDAAAGRVLDALREHGLDDDTLVLFTTDHGIALPRAKCTLYDPGLEVAMIARWPGRGWTGGAVRDELISNLDVVPTLLEALGLPVGDRVQGRSFLGLLDGSVYEPREEIFGEITYHDYYDPRRCVRTKDHKLIANFTSAPAYMDSSQSWKRRSTPKQDPREYHPPYELYDLTADPDELDDRAGDPEYATVEKELLARLGAWMRETGDPLLDGAVANPLQQRVLGALQSRRS
jgi:N-sulfoglucosamine sulfohydrolase